MPCLKLLNEHIFNIFGVTGTSQQCNQPSKDQLSAASPPGTSPAQPALQQPASPPRAHPQQPASQGPASVQPALQGFLQAPASTPVTQVLHHVLHKLVSWFQFDIIFNILQE